MSKPSMVVCASLALLSLCAQAAPPAGLSFSHHDWELVCDNTRTCRAAGYQSDGDEMSVSVLLTRKAGPGQPVEGQLMIGQYGENTVVDQLPAVFKLAMRINDKAVGQQLVVKKETLVADLSAQQVAALLATLSRASSIAWVVGDKRWQLSDKGAAAVLLKMDEFQGRVGTQGALVKKGPGGEDAVLPPLPMPVVSAAALSKPLPGDAQFAAKHAKALRKALRAAVKRDDNCPKLTEPEAGEAPAALSVSRLSDSKLLVSTPCWTAAYNFGEGYWVIDNAPPFRPVLVTESGSADYADGSISASQKGRGLGDCWSSDAWTWDGKEFIHTSAATTGMCKLLAPGGGWSMPTIVTDVRPAGR